MRLIGRIAAVSEYVVSDVIRSRPDPRSCGSTVDVKSTSPCIFDIQIALIRVYRSLPFSTLPEYYRHNLVMGNLLLLLNEPVLLGWSSGAGLSLSLNLDGRILVCLQLLGDIGLLWRSWCLWWGELLNAALSIGSLDGGWLVGLELLEVKVLNDVGWIIMLDACTYEAGNNCRVFSYLDGQQSGP